MRIENHLMSIVLILRSFMLPSCRERKAGTDEKMKEPFGVTSEMKSQILQPSHWTFEVEQNGHDEATLISTVELDSGWHLYSQHISDKVATKFAYDSLNTYSLIGVTQEGDAIRKYEPYLEMEVLIFEREAVFKQKVKVISEMDFTITGTVDYMVCLDQSQCVHSDEEFAFNVKGIQTIN